ncbi:U3 small nucleolar ribonucleoprotein protein MPP10-like [Amphibalanus amphitrite]|uniref:U3 small nucleolar ribonucleoprotein protein MPP10-like n=1 Tax=Amphibalanus amphitrite TaxID=1232801 RepID=UPI001C9153A4|nr:U3 small nucleolar ribonucleoprotein protein MPP10-like [Amphibalanus amphitrite]
MEKLLKDFSHLTKKPENFLRPDAAAVEEFKKVTKGLYDIAADSLKNKAELPIQELIIDGFDEEQIWQELELLNELEWPALSRDVSRLVAASEQLALTVQPVGDATDAASPAQQRDGADVDAGSEDGEDGMDESEEDGDGDGSDVEDGDGGEDGESEDGDSLGDSEGDGESDQEAAASGDEGEALPERPRTARSVVDDQFFRLGELEQFLERQDRQFERERLRRPDEDEQGGLDLFTETAGEERAARRPRDDDGADDMAMFADFFDPPDDAPAKGNKGKKDLLASDSEGEDVSDILGSTKKSTELKSSLEVRQERLRSRIEQLEEENLAEKSWQQRGETAAAGRHENALLEEYVDFEQTRRAPVTTAQVTAEIERLILRRIKDKAWDDVERKVKPVTDPYQYKKKLLLDQEKSKLSLAQIYEQEYLKQKADAEKKPEVDLGLAHDEVEDVPKEHEEIRRLMADLTAKLDTLTNFHYVPKQSSAEVRIISKLPSIAMEEVTPLGASNATLLAPEEIKDKRRSQLLAKEERTDTDKKRERRGKKRRQAAQARGREEKERQQATQPAQRRSAGDAKRLAEAQLARAEKRGNVIRADEKVGKKALKSSSAFFSQLQDQVTAQVTGAPPAKKKRKKATSVEVARMKL